MKKIISILLAFAIMATLAVAVSAEAETSTITVEMADAYSDGWDDNARILMLSVPSLSDVDNDEDVLATFTLASGASATASVEIEKNQTVYFFWLYDDDGIYNYEDSFTIKRDGLTIYSHVDAEDSCPLQKWERICISEPKDVRNTTVTYEIAPTFTVTIPATVALGGEATITAENVVVAKGEQVVVSLESTNEFKVTSAEGAELTYSVMSGENAVSEGDPVLKVDPTDGKSGSTTLRFVAPTEYTYSGEYTGTAIFTVAVKPIDRISFTIYDYLLGNITYKAAKGMTWGEWVESEYNTDGYTETSDGSGVRGPNGGWIVTSEGYHDVLPDQQIIADKAYEVCTP